MEKTIFDRSGIAALSDIEATYCAALFKQLETTQSSFRAKESEFRSPDYKWPREPLYTWSRAWEYPYAYHHIRKAVAANAVKGGKLRVVDFGSGVTFFPFSVAALGCDVTCVDIDPLGASDIPRASKAMGNEGGRVDFKLADGKRLPFADEEMDVIYCVSVLEHIPEPQKIIGELARILKPGGRFILTIDLDLRGDAEIGIAAYARLRDAISHLFDYGSAVSTVHPADMLINTSGPYGMSLPRGMIGLKFKIKRAIRSLMGRKPRSPLPYLLTVEGLDLVKKVCSHPQSTP